MKVDVKTYPVWVSLERTTTKKVVHRWGHEIGDTREYTVGHNGSRMWIRGPHVDLSGPVELLVAIAAAITEVIDHDATTTISPPPAA